MCLSMEICSKSYNGKNGKRSRGQQKKHPQLMIYTGFPGSGKSTIAETIATQMDAALFPLDLTLIQRDKRSTDSFCDKYDFKKAEDIFETLMASHSVTFPGYSQVTGQCDQEISIRPRPLLILEGVLPYHISAIQKYSHVAYWVHAPIETCEARQMARWRHHGWYAGLSEAEAVQRIHRKRTEELPTILDQKWRCPFVLDNSANHELYKESIQNGPHGSNYDNSTLLVVANDSQKSSLARILSTHCDVIGARYDVFAGTTGSLAIAKEIFPKDKCFKDLGHGPEWGDILAITHMLEALAAGHRLESIALFDPKIQDHQPFKNALLLSLIKANAVFWPTEATATAFFASLGEKDITINV